MVLCVTPYLRYKKVGFGLPWLPVDFFQHLRPLGVSRILGILKLLGSSRKIQTEVSSAWRSKVFYVTQQIFLKYIGLKSLSGISNSLIT